MFTIKRPILLSISIITLFITIYVANNFINPLVASLSVDQLNDGQTINGIARLAARGHVGNVIGLCIGILCGIGVMCSFKSKENKRRTTNEK